MQKFYSYFYMWLHIQIFLIDTWISSPNIKKVNETTNNLTAYGYRSNMVHHRGIQIYRFLGKLLFFVAELVLDLGEVELLAGAPLEDVQHVQAGGLEVRGRIKRFRYEDLGFEAAVDGHEVVGDRDKLLLDGAEEVQAWFDLHFGVVGFDSGRHHRYEPPFGGYLESQKRIV